MPQKTPIKTAYDEILKAEIATTAAYEISEKNPAHVYDELAVAINHLNTATQQLETLRKKLKTK